MPKILSYHHPSGKEQQENPFKTLWYAFSRLDKNLRFALITFLFIIISVPIINSTVQTLTQHAAGNDAITPGTLILDSTFNSIGIELPFTGDDLASATATLEFKKSYDTTWRQGLPLWRTDGSTFSDGKVSNNDIYGRTFYGSVLLTDPGYTYDIRVTVQDPNGVVGNSVLTSSITTRAEDIPDPAALTPTYFVDSTNGSDSNNGTSTGSAWKTLQQAWATAPSGAIVQFAPGYYTTPTTTRANPITLKAQYPAVSYDTVTKTWTENSTSQHSIIDSGVVTGPSATDSAYPNVWQQVTLTSPGYPDNGGTVQNYTVWKWPNAPFTKLPDASNTMFVGYATTHQNEPQRLPYWENTSSQNSTEMGTPAAWAEKVFTNKSYNYGATLYSNGSGGYDMYIRLPGDANPNNFYITSEQNYVDGSIPLYSSNNRISGFDLHLTSVVSYAGSNFNVLDHNKVTMAAFLTDGDVGAAPTYQPSTYSDDNVVEYNIFKDSNQRTPTNVNGITSGPFPWYFVKGYIVNADGTQYGYRIGGMAELGPIDGRGMGRREVFRFNEVDGFHDGPHTGYNPDFDRYANEGLDINDNYIHNIADDALETGDADINIRMWNNRVDTASVFESIHFSNFGPIYFFRNTGWNIGTDGMTDPGDGNYGAAGLGIKYDTASTVNFRNYWINNTIWTNSALGAAGGSTTNTGSLAPDLYFRNNIVRVTNRTFDINGPNVPLFTGKFSDENDWWATQNTNNWGMRWGSDYLTAADVASYRSVSGTGTNSNRYNGTDYAFTDYGFLDSNLTNPASGNLTLVAGSAFIDAGVVVPNIADWSGINYAGTAPDLGATETGTLITPTPGPTTPPTPTPTAGPTSIPTPTSPPGSTPTPTPPTITNGPLRVYAGASTYTDSQAQTWTSDAAYASGGSINTTTNTIVGTTDQTLYQDSRYGDFSYTLPLTNGDYQVTLKFAEPYWTQQGQREFNVSINGQQVLSNFDILSQTQPDTALDKMFTTTVTNNTLTITFTSVVDKALVSAIQILSVLPTPTLAQLTPTSVPTSTTAPTATITQQIPTSTPVPTSSQSSQNTSPKKVGDVNGDGHINLVDLSALLAKWGTSDANADLNHSGKVDLVDLSMLLSNWGK